MLIVLRLSSISTLSIPKWAEIADRTSV